MRRFEKYLAEVGIKEGPILNRLTTIYNICAGSFHEEIIEIFVSEIKNNDGSRVYEHVSLFTENYIIDIVEPIGNEIQWNVASYKKAFGWAELSSFNFDFEKANDDSKLKVLCRNFLEMNLSYSFKATGTNCNHLWSIYKEHIQRNLSKVNEKSG
ncbi:hypothetical protein [Paenibacillus sp. MZ03-122A]|uniref:hypothetical protein n=1 Tax=Paenibacillus sp. MZ03-122A TaxID=2962033 RepID=UPI0020B8B3BD|nr:hypothetical protein [Paenibacillus sp. MZ03-122A]MCP3778789.1 hypothetical protein [Paenibacillus sp. MZ03-122A]